MTTHAKILTPAQALAPRVVSLRELRQKLAPLVLGWSWADDAINDLWKLGAPDPQASLCPQAPPCPARECKHIKRILLPNQFAKWVAEVEQRKGMGLSPAKLLPKLRNNM